MKKIFGFVFFLAFKNLACQTSLRMDSACAFYAETGIGTLLFKGDLSKVTLNGGQISPGFRAGIACRNWSSEANLFMGSFSRNNSKMPSLENIRGSVRAGDLRINWKKGVLKGKTPVSIFLGAGLGLIRFESYTDLKDRNGKDYFAWTDGTLRDAPEMLSNKFTSNVLSRDYIYETPLAINQHAVYVPFAAGVRVNLKPEIYVSFAWENILLQTDQLDRSTLNPANDKLTRFSISLGYNFHKNTGRDKDAKIPVRKKYADKNEFAFLKTDDEDNDGVPDETDQCFNTPSGINVGKDGCPADSDLDGIFDFLDKEPASPPGSWVDQSGVALTDEQIQAKANDSIAWFVSALRKFSKNSRPYPVKKFIPVQNYERFARLLDEHPEWRIYHGESSRRLPTEFQPIDLNNDNILSVKELEIAVNKIFDQTPGSLNPEQLNKAIKYAFEIQN